MKTPLYITVFPIPLILAVDRDRHISIKQCTIYTIVRHNIPDFIFLASMHINTELLSNKKLFRSLIRHVLYAIQKSKSTVLISNNFYINQNFSQLCILYSSDLRSLEAVLHVAEAETHEAEAIPGPTRPRPRSGFSASRSRPGLEA